MAGNHGGVFTVPVDVPVIEEEAVAVVVLPIHHQAQEVRVQAEVPEAVAVEEPVVVKAQVPALVLEHPIPAAEPAAEAAVQADPIHRSTAEPAAAEAGPIRRPRFHPSPRPRHHLRTGRNGMKALLPNTVRDPAATARRPTERRDSRRRPW